MESKFDKQAMEESNPAPIHPPSGNGLEDRWWDIALIYWESFILQSYTCYKCNTTFTSKSKPSNPNRPFCSRSCSAQVNNKEHPKRREEGVCSICQSPCPRRYKTCSSCRHLKRGREYYESMTLDSYRNKLSVKDKHRSWLNVHVRYFARKWTDISEGCAWCGYTKHVEVCHVIPVSSFSGDRTLGEVNSSDNIIVLCRNCHWEFDNLPR